MATAKAVCASCPVRAECLAEALARIPYGIAGGLTEQERAALRRRSRTITGSAARLDTETVLATGRTHRQVAPACEVRARTSQQWATTTPSTTTRNTTAAASALEARRTTDSALGMGEGSHGGHRAPLGSPTPSTPRQAHEQRKDTETR